MAGIQRLLVSALASYRADGYSRRTRYMQRTFGIATRFYGLTKGDVERLATWVDAALVVVPAENIFVAIHAEADLSGSQEFMHSTYPKVVTFPVTPWGKVVLAP